MNWLNDLKTSVKLIGSFILIAAILVVLAVLSFTNMKSINDGMTTLYLDRTIPIQDLGGVDSQLYRMRGDVYKYVLVAIQEEITTTAAEVNRLVAKYRATYLVKEEVDGLAVFDTAWADYQKKVQSTLELAKGGNTQAAIQQLQVGGGAYNGGIAVRGAV
jgi:methyl-accepting chemotaxis protein